MNHFIGQYSNISHSQSKEKLFSFTAKANESSVKNHVVFLKTIQSTPFSRDPCQIVVFQIPSC